VTPDDTVSGEVCVGNTYNYEGIEYAVGSYDIEKIDTNGCLYTTVLTVTAYDVTPDIVNDVTICEGDSYFWSVDGLTYSVNDSPVMLNLTDANGCSYSATLTITEDDAPNAGANGTLTVCEGIIPTNEELFASLEGVPNEGGLWSGPVSDVYTYTFAASGSCPEVSATVTVDYFEATPDLALLALVCEGTTFNYEGIEYEVGLYTIPKTDANGCSYAIQLAVTPLDVTPDDTATGEVCVGSTFNYEGTEYVVGSYDIPRTDVNGCSYKTVLTVSAYEVTPDDTATGEVCLGSTFNYEGSEYAVGSYDIPRTDANGCTYTTILTVNSYESTPNIEEDVTVCEGGTYTWLLNGMTYSVSDSPVVIELQDVNGCSYSATLYITETLGLNAGEDGVLTVCAGETPTFEELFSALGSSADEGGVWSQDSNGDYVYTFEATENCPGSSAYVKLYYYESTPNIEEDVTVCEGGTYTWLLNGMTYSVSDSPVVIELQDVNGCSYSATLYITETLGLNAGEDGVLTVCAGETPTFEELFSALGSSADEGGVWSQDSNGDYVYTFEATENCPGSSAYVKVYYYESTPNIEEEVTIAEGASYTWSITNETYTVEDSPVIVDVLDDNGCSYNAILKITEDNSLSVNDLDINDISVVKVFPVPHDQFINILYEFGFDTDVSIQVIDVRGVILKDIKINDYGSNSERITKIDLSRISDQLLIIKVTSDRGSIIKKIVPSTKK
uniref:hypothetical protein n=1 Tax=Psychroserpens damuponensis TaxID=943936 RepID=UPI00058AFF7B